MGNSETTYYGFPDKFLDIFTGYHSQVFGLCLFGKVIDSVYLNAGRAVGIGLIKSIPQTTKGQGEFIEVSFSGCYLGMLENLWHLLHFLAKFMASTFIVGQKYPCLRAL